MELRVAETNRSAHLIASGPTSSVLWYSNKAATVFDAALPLVLFKTALRRNKERYRSWLYRMVALPCRAPWATLVLLCSLAK